MRYVIGVGVLIALSLLVNHYSLTTPTDSSALSGVSTVLAILAFVIGGVGTWKAIRGRSRRKSQPEEVEVSQDAKLAALDHKVERVKKELELLEIEKKILKLKESEFPE